MMHRKNEIPMKKNVRRGDTISWKFSLTAQEEKVFMSYDDDGWIKTTPDLPILSECRDKLCKREKNIGEQIFSL